MKERSLEQDYMAVPKYMPVIFTVILLTNIVVGVWFASSVHSRISILEKFYNEMSGINDQINRIDKKINRIIRAVK